MTAIATSLKLDGRTREARRLKADAARREEIAAGLLADLGRRPNMTDKVWAQNLAVLVWRAEVAEAIGEDSTELRRLINQSMRAGGQKPQKPTRPRQESMEEYLRRTADGRAAP